MIDNRPRILVIKLGALGDIVQAAGPFAAIRRHHQDAHITLLTTRPFVELLEQAPWFNDIWIDDRPKMWHWRRWRELRQTLVRANFRRVYDLQTSDRSGYYFRLLPSGTEWSGIVRGASHQHDHPDREKMHTIDRQTEQLAVAGVAAFATPDWGWLSADLGDFDLPDRYGLLVPGGSEHRPEKRWPAENYAALAQYFLRQNITPVIIGGPPEVPLGQQIRNACDQAINLTGRTSFAQIFAVARRAVCAVGNDTGPMHLIVAAGTPTTVLFSGASDPALCAPRGPDEGHPVEVLRRERLTDLAVNEVEAALRLG